MVESTVLLYSISYQLENYVRLQVIYPSSLERVNWCEMKHQQKGESAGPVRKQNYRIYRWIIPPLAHFCSRRAYEGGIIQRPSTT
jgi:hypothetical protein